MTAANTAVFTHAECLHHRTTPGHPEQIARLEVILTALRDIPETAVTWVDAPLAPEEALTQVHTPAHLETVRAAIPADAESWAMLDGDTPVSQGSWKAALRAAGAAIAAVDAVMEGRFSNAFCAVRPPGHHAEPERAMGFCLFNTVGVAARHAQAVHGLSRVAVIDFDVHHGNGTQALAMADERLFFGSIHAAGIYPGTGAAYETGPAGNVVNAALGPGITREAWRDAYVTQIVGALDAFEPELVLVSAGFDAHAADPLADFPLHAEDFGWATDQLLAIAARHCGGRLVSTLEGGYDLDALALSATAHVRALCAGA